MRALLVVLACLLAASARAATYYVTVAGLGGEPEYEQRFAAEARELDRTFKAAGSTAHVYTLSGSDATAPAVRSTIAAVAHGSQPADDFILVLLGHGSYDGAEYKFNLPGPDLSAAELAALCNSVPAKRQLVVDTTSASGGAVAVLMRPGRAVIAATKTGTEKNATVFARFWVEAMQDPAADTDKNDAVSAMEAFTYAATKTAAFYDGQKRLATEHAVFNDTGSGEAARTAVGAQGRLLANLTIVRYGTTASAGSSPAKQKLLLRKEALESRIDVLKYNKAAMDPGDYRKQLTAALLELAQVQGELDK